MIAVIDYGAANLLSITNALNTLGADAQVVSAPDELSRACGLVLPGVGAAGTAMANLERAGLAQAIHEQAKAGVPLLGVCLGMQLFFEEIEEGNSLGLGILSGQVRRLPAGVKIPHMGWNEVNPVANEAGHQLFSGAKGMKFAYFVHSYYCLPASSESVAATTSYGETWAAAVAQGTVWGVQFHPEKSGEEGLRLLRRWLARTAEPLKEAAHAK